MRKRYFAATAAGVALVTLIAPYILLNKVPELQSLKKMSRETKEGVVKGFLTVNQEI